MTEWDDEDRVILAAESIWLLCQTITPSEAGAVLAMITAQLFHQCSGDPDKGCAVQAEIVREHLDELRAQRGTLQ
jgi:hypothetical protein